METGFRIKAEKHKIGKLPDYFALSKNNDYYMELDQFQLNHCVGHMGYRICDPYMVQISTQQPKCSLRLFRNNPRDINGHCDVEFYESSDYPTEVVPLGNGQVLLATNKTRWTVNCDKQSPRILQGCKFCVLHLNCSCSLRGIAHYIPQNLATCGDVHHTEIMQEPVNAMGYMKLLWKICNNKCDLDCGWYTAPNWRNTRVKIQWSWIRAICT